MRKGLWLFFIPVVCLLFVGSLLAIETGEIKGKVMDEDGAPLPGVTVMIKSPSLQGIRSTVTAVDGTYRFPLLPIGKYDVTYEIKGFEKKTEQGYDVRLGFTLTLETKLKLSALEEEVVVTAQTPIIDKTKTDTRQEGDQHSSHGDLSRQVSVSAAFTRVVVTIELGPRSWRARLRW